MKRIGWIHESGVVCVLIAIIFLGNIVFKILSPSGGTEIEGETYDLVNYVAIMFLLGFFAILFFLWNISAEIRDFMKAIVLVEKDKGEKEDGK
jgi:hypothetical protein